MSDETIDVLAVMDDAIGDVMVAQASGVATDISIPEMCTARAALAGLIEADKRVSERSRKKAGGGFWMVSNEDMAALRAALARAGATK